jgi:hypothetical protein
MSICVCATQAQEPVIPAAGIADGTVVAEEASIWSDMTAMFRPSRWRHPIKEGGTLSWLNYHAWAAAPGHTAKILSGEVIVIGGTYWILCATGAIGGGSSGGAAIVGGGGGEMPF